MEKRDKIEEIFQENFKDFKVQPDPSVWSGIQTNIPTNPPGLSSGLGSLSVAGKVVVGLAVASGIALSAYFLQKDEVTDKVEKQKIETENTVLEKAKVEEMGSPLFIDTMTMEEEVVEFPAEAKTVEVQTTSTIEEVKNDPQAQEEQGSMLSGKSDEDTDSSTSTTDKVAATESRENGLSETSASTPASGSNTTSSTNVELAEYSTEKEPEVEEIQEPVGLNETAGSNGIPKEEKEEVEEIGHVIPNIFTPNQDGMNDVFRIETEDATDIEVAILDKSGKIVFEWKGLYGFWDGKLSNGNPAEVGDYFYRVLLIKNDLRIPKTGWVRLER